MKIEITYRREDILNLIVKDIQSRADIVEFGRTKVMTCMSIIENETAKTICPNNVIEHYVATIDIGGNDGSNY